MLIFYKNCFVLFAGGILSEIGLRSSGWDESIRRHCLESV